MITRWGSPLVVILSAFCVCLQGFCENFERISLHLFRGMRIELFCDGRRCVAKAGGNALRACTVLVEKCGMRMAERVSVETTLSEMIPEKRVLAGATIVERADEMNFCRVVRLMTPRACRDLSVTVDIVCKNTSLSRTDDTLTFPPSVEIDGQRVVDRDVSQTCS